MTLPVIRAAGGVVWRPATDRHGEPGIEVVVIHRPRYDDWSLPKGKLAPGEPEVEGAVREVLEETGLRVHIGRPLGETRYPKAVAGLERTKVVHWWAMRADSGSFSPNQEIDDLRWVTLDQAEAMVARDTDREVLRRFAQGPAPTRTVLLVRNASAGTRATWAGDDRRRPLDADGWAQADGLARLLSRFDVAEIISADLDRCTQTLAPLAEALGLEIRLDPRFSPAGYAGREGEATTAARAAGGPDRDGVVCTTSDVLPDLLRRIAEHDHRRIGVPVIARKGSVWALTFSGDRLLETEYIPQPELAAIAQPAGPETLPA